MRNKRSKKKYKEIIYEIVRKDMAGNTIVKCPVCNTTFKRDGVRAHINGLARWGDEEHAEWKAKNKV